MQKKFTTTVVFLFFFLSVFLGVGFLNADEIMLMLVASSTIGLVALYARPMTGFAILIAYVLGHGFYSVAFAWGKEMNLGMQSIQIWKQCIFSLSAIASWFFIYSINDLRDQMLTLDREVKKLRKLEPSTSILTFHEFMERAKLLITGMGRREEKAYCLWFQVQPKKEYQQRVVYEKMTKLLLQSIRANYDLIGNAGDRKAVVFLSNTDEEGVQVVLRRFLQKVEKEPNLTVNDFTYEIHDVAADFSVFAEAISGWKQGEAS